MSPISSSHTDVALMASSSGFTAPDLQSVLSDALLSFSPLATLVGADSARTSFQRASNAKQAIVASMAPIGALGMVATVAKASRLSWIKDMLGVGDADIRDAARDLGCAAIKDGVIPSMDKDGMLICNGKAKSVQEAACALIREDWQNCKRQGWLRALREFTGATMTGRLVWDAQSETEAVRLLKQLQDAVEDSESIAADVFDRMEGVRSDQGGSGGSIELLWPAPAMPLETNALIAIIYPLLFLFAFLATSILSSTLLHWQSWRSSILLSGGHLMLVISQIAAQIAVKRNCQKIEVEVKTKSSQFRWILIDQSFATSIIAERVEMRPEFTLSQFHAFNSPNLSSWQVLLLLGGVLIGFISFFIGVKSSSAQTVLTYIVLYVLANLLKGPIIFQANKAMFTRWVNSPGHVKKVRTTTGVSPTPKPPIDPSVRRSSDSTITSSSTLVHDKLDSPDLLHKPAPFKIFCKFSLQRGRALQQFCFSETEEWVLAAHVIHKIVRSVVDDDEIPQNREMTETMLQIPVYHGYVDPVFRGILALDINRNDPQSLFWSLCMELSSVILDSFTRSDRICSDCDEASKVSLLSDLVFSCVRMLISDLVYCDRRLLPCQRLGAYTLMKAVQEVVNNHPNPSAGHSNLAGALHYAAEAAKKCKGAKDTSKELRRFEDSRFRKLQGEEATRLLAELDQAKQCYAQSRLLVQHADRLMVAKDHVHEAQLTQPSELASLGKVLKEVMDPSIQPVALPLQRRIGSVLDRVASVSSSIARDHLSYRQDLLWEESQELLKDDIRDSLPEVSISGYTSHFLSPLTRTQLLEVLRRRERNRKTQHTQSQRNIAKLCHEVRRDIHEIVALLGDLVLERECTIRQRLRVLLHKELQARLPSDRVARQELREELDCVRRNQEHMLKELSNGMWYNDHTHMGELDHPDEPGIIFNLLEREEQYLESVLDIEPNGFEIHIS